MRAPNRLPHRAVCGCIAAAILLAGGGWAGAGLAQTSDGPPAKAAGEPGAKPPYVQDAIAPALQQPGGGAPWQNQPAAGPAGPADAGPAASSSPYQSPWPKPWWDIPGAKPPADSPNVAASDPATVPGAPQPPAGHKPQQPIEKPGAADPSGPTKVTVGKAPEPPSRPPQPSFDWRKALLMAAGALLAAAIAGWWALRHWLRLAPMGDAGRQEIRFTASPGLHVVVQARAGQADTRLHFHDPQVSS